MGNRIGIRGVYIAAICGCILLSSIGIFTYDSFAESKIPPAEYGHHGKAMKHWIPPSVIMKYIIKQC